MPAVNNHIHLINELFNQPHLVTASYFKTLCGAVAERLNIPHIEFNGERIAAQQLKIRAELYNSEQPNDRRYFYESKDGIAIIPIGGTLVHKNGYLNTVSGMTGYDGIKRRIDYAMSDPQIKAIMYVYSTPGGHVVGNFELADYMHSLKGIKPTAALIDAQAASAGYSLASTADYRYITEHSTAGSIGVLLPHVSQQQQLKNQGVKVDIIHAGNHKIDGNPYQDLSSEVRNKMQATVNTIYDRFTSSVARNLNIDEGIIRDTQADIYMGKEAVDIGLADELTPSFEAFDRFKSFTASQQKTTVSLATTTLTTKAKGPITQGNTIMPETKENAPAAQNNPVITGEQMKARVSTILTQGSALGLAAVAQCIALDTNVSAEDASTILTSVSDNMPTVEANNEQDGAAAFSEQIAKADAGNISPEANSEITDQPVEATQLERVLNAANKSGLKAKI